MECIGYGAVVDSNVSLRKDAFQIFKEMSLDSFVDEVFKDNLYGHDYTDIETFEEFCDQYESCKTPGNYGFYGLIADYINEQCDLGPYKFLYEDFTIYIPCDIPKNEEEKRYFPTQEMINTVLTKYLFPLFEEPLTTDFYTIRSY